MSLCPTLALGTEPGTQSGQEMFGVTLHGLPWWLRGLRICLQHMPLLLYSVEHGIAMEPMKGKWAPYLSRVPQNTVQVA